VHTDEPAELLESDGQGEHSFTPEPYLFQNVFAGQEQPRPVDVDPAGQDLHEFSALLQYVLGGQVQALPAPPNAPTGHATQLLLEACQYSVDKHRLASMLSDTLFISA
jgi:hypothetical protein